MSSCVATTIGINRPIILLPNLKVGLNARALAVFAKSETASHFLAITAAQSARCLAAYRIGSSMCVSLIPFLVVPFPSFLFRGNKI